MKLTLLQAGETPSALRDRYERFPPFFETLFNRGGEGFSFDMINLIDGEVPPDPAGLEAALITGSAAGVYDRTPWMEPLGDFIRAAHARKLPLAGICFGHQVIAGALGGDVRKSEKGWGIGRHVYRVDQDTMPGKALGPCVALAASHQDQVITPPAGARVFMASDFTPNAGLVYANGTTISMQPHPEFPPAYAAALYAMRAERDGTHETAGAAIKSLDQPVDNDKVARVLADFIKQAAF